MRRLDGSRWAGMCFGYGVLCVLCGWGMCFISGHVYLWDSSMFVFMYMMTGWSPGMFDLMFVCMHVCVFSVFLLYIIIILLCRFITLGQ